MICEHEMKIDVIQILRMLMMSSGRSEATLSPSRLSLYLHICNPTSRSLCQHLATWRGREDVDYRDYTNEQNLMLSSMYIFCPWNAIIQ